MPHRLLLAEDEPAIADTIRYAAETEGFALRWCATSREALAAFETEGADLLILDVGLPDGSGFDLCRSIRRLSDVPVVFLTARGDVVDRVVGLEIGGDDYMTKPFSPRELMARVRARLRRRTHPGRADPAAPNPVREVSATFPSGIGGSGRGAGSEATPHSIPDLPALEWPGSPDIHPRERTSGEVRATGRSTIESSALHRECGLVHDAERCRISFHGHVLELARQEYRLLATLIEKPGRVWSREQLMERAWEEPQACLERTVDAHIRSLRAKLRTVRPDADPIATHRGLGYSLREDL